MCLLVNLVLKKRLLVFFNLVNQYWRDDLTRQLYCSWAKLWRCKNSNLANYVTCQYHFYVVMLHESQLCLDWWEGTSILEIHVMDHFNFAPQKFLHEKCCLTISLGDIICSCCSCCQVLENNPILNKYKSGDYLYMWTQIFPIVTKLYMLITKINCCLYLENLYKLWTKSITLPTHEQFILWTKRLYFPLCIKY